MTVRKLFARVIRSLSDFGGSPDEVADVESGREKNNAHALIEIDPSLDLHALIRVIGNPQNARIREVSGEPPEMYDDVLAQHPPERVAYASIFRRGQQQGGLVILTFRATRVDVSKAFAAILKGDGFDPSQLRHLNGTHQLISRYDVQPYGRFFMADARFANAVVCLSLATAPQRVLSHESYFQRVLAAMVRFSHAREDLASEATAVERAAIERTVVRIRPLVEPHLRTLHTKSKQLVRQDDYGELDVSQWAKEVEYFTERFVLRQAVLAPVAKYLAMNAVLQMVADYELKLIESNPLPIDARLLDPAEFERYCAQVLETTGWSARATKRSGDQGVDVIAQRGSIKAVLQCKRVGTPVGNAAVQEVIAGRVFEGADLAAVVSTAGYTVSAHQLASAADVLLLSPDDLPHLAALAGLAAAPYEA